jgi:hypothetical protein
MEANVDPLFRGPDWKPITPKRGSFLHADSQRNGVARGLLTAWRRQFAATARSKAASFVPVRIVEESR